jgi:hypothetical protein
MVSLTYGTWMLCRCARRFVMSRSRKRVVVGHPDDALAVLTIACEYVLDNWMGKTSGAREELGLIQP